VKEKTLKDKLPDVQKSKPVHLLPINRVGIQDLSYPVVVFDKRNERQHTIGKITMSVDLPAHWRGTHMSRFIEIINRYRGEITKKQIRAILDKALVQFEATAAHIKIEFPYFIEKTAPVSGEKSLLEYSATFDGELDPNGFRFRLGARVPAQTLCPCSKEISERGAHNQRASIEISVLCDGFVWIEELIEIAENAASSPVYSLLKREDEKEITERAFDNPKFVEDVVRGVASELGSRQDILDYTVRAISDESIHNHCAFAQINGKRAIKKRGSQRTAPQK
jgi:GTP cyclohydrolase IB